MKKIILDQDAYISNSEYYEASAHFEGEEEGTLNVKWEIITYDVDEDTGETVEHEADEDCSWDNPVYIYDYNAGENIYNGYDDKVKFSERFTL